MAERVLLPECSMILKSSGNPEELPYLYSKLSPARSLGSGEILPMGHQPSTNEAPIRDLRNVYKSGAEGSRICKSTDSRLAKILPIGPRVHRVSFLFGYCVSRPGGFLLKAWAFRNYPCAIYGWTDRGRMKNPSNQTSPTSPFGRPIIKATKLSGTFGILETP